MNSQLENDFDLFKIIKNPTKKKNIEFRIKLYLLIKFNNKKENIYLINKEWFRNWKNNIDYETIKNIVNENYINENPEVKKIDEITKNIINNIQNKKKKYLYIEQEDNKSNNINNQIKEDLFFCEDYYDEIPEEAYKLLKTKYSFSQDIKKSKAHKTFIYYEETDNFHIKYLMYEKLTEKMFISFLSKYFKTENFDYHYINETKVSLEKINKKFKDILQSNFLIKINFTELQKNPILIQIKKPKKKENKNLEKRYLTFSGNVGLPNLGNTCYLNSVIQILSQIYQLSHFFLTEKYKEYINKENNMGSNGIIVLKFGKVIDTLWSFKDVIIQNFEMNKKNYEAYYYDQEKETNIKQIMINLLEEISKNNVLYKGYEQHDALEFFIYFIDILHEDLNQAKKKELLNLLDGKNSLEEIFEYKWKLFENYNDSFISKMFYGMNHSEITCYECYNVEHIFETFNVLTLPVFINSNKPSKEEIKNLKNNNKKKLNKKINFPGKNQLYFCKCRIIPYNLNNNSFEINIPIQKKIYANFNIGELSKIIYNIIKDDNFKPVILSKNKTKIISIPEDTNFLCQLFSNPINLEIHYIQIEDKKLDLKVIKKNIEPDNFLKIFNNIQIESYGTISAEEINIEYEDSKKSNPHFSNENSSFEQSSNYEFNSQNIYDYYFLNAINIVVKESNTKEFLKFPGLFKFSQLENLEVLYQNIFNYYKNIDSEIKENKNFKKEKYSLKDWSDDISTKEFSKHNLELNLKNPNFEKENPYPFILCFCLKNKNLEENNSFYIPIPYSNELFINYSNKIKNNNDKGENYEFKNYIIYIIWFKSQLSKLKKIETKINANKIETLDPYLEIEKKNSLSQNIQTEETIINNMNSLNELLNDYIDYEKYDYNNSFYCEKCGKNVYAIKQLDIYYLPKILIIYFEKKISGYLHKIPITFPINEDLDLTKYSKRKSKDNIYELISVLNFTGNNITGHYNVYCKHPLSNKWHLFNDSACFIIEDINKEIKFEDVYAIVYKKKSFIIS